MHVYGASVDCTAHTQTHTYINIGHTAHTHVHRVQLTARTSHAVSMHAQLSIHTFQLVHTYTHSHTPRCTLGRTCIPKKLIRFLPLVPAAGSRSKIAKTALPPLRTLVLLAVVAAAVAALAAVAVAIAAAAATECIIGGLSEAENYQVSFGGVGGDDGVCLFHTLALGRLMANTRFAAPPSLPAPPRWEVLLLFSLRQPRRNHRFCRRILLSLPSLLVSLHSFLHHLLTRPPCCVFIFHLRFLRAPLRGGGGHCRLFAFSRRPFSHSLCVCMYG